MTDSNAALQSAARLLQQGRAPEALATLERKALANGVEDIRRLSGADACALEPELRCIAALLCAFFFAPDCTG